jgi:hypothetical protein
LFFFSGRQILHAVSTNFSGVSQYATIRTSPTLKREKKENPPEKKTNTEEKKDLVEEKQTPEKKENENESKKKHTPEKIESEKIEKPPLPQKPKSKTEKLKQFGNSNLINESNLKIDKNELKISSEKTNEKRIDILKELIEFEKNFVQIMSNFENTFITPIMRIKDQLKTEQSSIFFTILPKNEVIFGIHDTFLSNIEHVLTNFTSQSSLSRYFKTMVKLLK